MGSILLYLGGHLITWEESTKLRCIRKAGAPLTLSLLLQTLGLNLRQNISNLKLKLTLDYSKGIKAFTVSHTKREIRKYYESLGVKNVLDSKEFWKTMRPFLSDKNTVFLQISIEKIPDYI